MGLCYQGFSAEIVEDFRTGRGPFVQKPGKIMEYRGGKKGALDNAVGPFNINEPVKLLLVRVMLETSSVGVLPYMD